MGKISVKHFFNNKLKTESIKGKNYKPLYVQIVRNTRTHQIRSVFITEKITDAQLQSPEIIKLCKQEKEFILSFFEFAQNAINDFVVTDSKTNLGILINFFKEQIYDVLTRYGFTDLQTRQTIYEKIKNYIIKKTDFDEVLTHSILKNYLDNDFNFDNEFNNVKKLHELKILTDKEAAKIEFQIMLFDFTIDNNSLTLFDWFSKRSEILQQIEEKTQFSTKEQILEYATGADDFIKNLFSDFYNNGFYVDIYQLIEEKTLNLIRKHRKYK